MENILVPIQKSEEDNIITLPNGKRFPRKVYSEYTKDELKEVIACCRNIKHVTTTLKIHGSYAKYINEFIILHKIDITHFTIKERTTESIENRLVSNSSGVKTETLKRYIITKNIVENKCAICNLPPIWNNKPLVLQLDHINGNNYDNRLENLRLLCPNCHTQTETFTGKNNREYKRKECEICKKLLHNNNTCGKCGNCMKKEREEGLCITCNVNNRISRYLQCNACKENNTKKICKKCSKPIMRVNNKTDYHKQCRKGEE